MAEGERRLAAVMFTDLVGYTSLAQRDESLAFELLEEHRRLLRPIFAKYRGREVKTIGDAFLVEFASALEAVRCATEAQSSLHSLNQSRSPDRQVLLRVGIHVGDVMAVGGDIQGDAVNIASRIQPLAEPGGICITEQVYYQVSNKLEVAPVSIGKKSLKNVETPVEVYKVVLPWNMTEDRSQAAAKTRIAVLPFINISPDPADEYIADGMTEELINVISRNHKLKVIARTSVGRFKGTEKSILDIGKEIGVGSILEGSVRKAGNKIRVTAQLIDAINEEHLWSDNFDRQMDDVFSIQSDIAKSVSDALAANLAPQERKSVERRATTSSTAYVLYLKGRTDLRSRKEGEMKEAVKCFERAIAEDGRFVEAYAGLADALFLLANYNYVPRDGAHSKGREALEKALSLDNSLAEAHASMGNYLAHDYRFGEAEAEFKRAIELNPNYFLTYHWYSILLLEMGRVEASLAETLRAEELEPLSPVIAFNLVSVLSFTKRRAESEERVRKLKELEPDGEYFTLAQGWTALWDSDFRAAVDHFREAVSRSPEDLRSASYLAVLYGRAGMKEDAARALKRMEALPDGTFGKPMHVGFALASLGRLDEAFENFNRAIEERSMDFRPLRYLPMDPKFKSDARYAGLFQRVGLSP